MDLKKSIVGVMSKIMKLPTGQVAGVKKLSDHFLRVKIQGEALKEISWSAGDKVQLNLNADFRTYTPLSWDPIKGETELLVFRHSGDTPGQNWLANLKNGDDVQFFGPRGSLDFAKLDDHIIFFGDETSFGAAYSLYQMKTGTARVLYVFEVSVVAESKKVLDMLGLATANVVAKEESGQKEGFAMMMRELRLNPEMSIVLTGNGKSIQSYRELLKAEGVSMGRVKAKPYWVPGKKGLD